MLREFRDITERQDYDYKPKSRNPSNILYRIRLSLLQFLTHSLADSTAECYLVIAEASDNPSTALFSPLLEFFPNLKILLLSIGGADWSGPVYKTESNNEESTEILNTKYRFIDVGRCNARILKEIRCLENVFFAYVARVNSARITTDADLCWNYALALRIIRTLKPNAYMVRFRCPYPIRRDDIDRFNNSPVKPDDTIIDFTGNMGRGLFEFLRGDKLFLQPYGASNGSDCSLVGTTLETKYYDIDDYEKKFAWFNAVYRKRRFNGIAADKAIVADIVDQYAAKYHPNGDRCKMMNVITN